MRPNTTQEAALFTVLKASRLLYNDALAEWKAHFEATRQYLSLYEQDKHYNKTTYPDVPAVVTDQVMKRLHRALAAYFKGRKEGRAVGCPRYKPPQRWHSIEFRKGPNALDGGYFKAPQQCGGRMRLNLHRPLQGTFKFVRIIKRPSGWYLQCICKDALHKVSRQYVNQYQTIVIEDLQPANMVRNHALALSISDSGWGILRYYLEYKAAEAGRHVEAVPSHYTSQHCSRCGEYVQKSLSVRTHLCPHCGFVADRDVNAAINILQARTGPSRSTA